ncbi:hypothetical protein K3495_g9316 [Podosphaera aphanis]|nr:hypothetical protein K3495_g9316 [Podosphaera aphanis]
MALYSPAATFEGVVAQIRNALYTEEQQPNVLDKFLATSSAQSLGTDQNYIEHKYQGGRATGNPYVKSFSQNNKGHPQKTRLNDFRSSRQKKCYICDKSGCWSTSHSPAERRAAFSRFSERPYFKKRPAIVVKYQSFWAEWEGVRDMIEIEKQDKVDQFLIEMDNSVNNYDEVACQDKNYDNEYFLRELGPANPFELVSYLTNQSTLHLITAQDIFKVRKQKILSHSISNSPNSVLEAESTILSRYSSTDFKV